MNYNVLHFSPVQACQKRSIGSKAATMKYVKNYDEDKVSEIYKA